METVKRLKGIKYRERVTINTKVFVSPWFDKKTDARNWKRSKLADKDRFAITGVYIDGSFKLEELFKKFLVSKQDKARRTLESYQSSYKCHISPLLGNLRLKDIRLHHGEQIKQTLWEKKLSAGRINDIIILCKMLLGYAVRQGNLLINPFDNLDKVKEVKKDIKFWTTEEIEIFLNSLRGRHYFSVFLFTLNSALRKSEVCGLMWDCIDFTNRIITVKRIRDRHGLKETTKGSESRKIPMNGVLYDELNRLYKGRQHPSYVFTKPNGEPISYEHLTDRIFNVEVEKCGLRKIRFHDLRTTYSSHFCINNGNVFVLSKILGHKSVTTTETHYAQINNQSLLNECERVSLSTNESLQMDNVFKLENLQPEPFQHRL
jgi:integrase